jgi:hypothetical protein
VGWAVVVFAVLGIAVLTRVAISMPGRSHRGPLPAQSPEAARVQDRLRRHVETLASEIGERHIWNPAGLAAAGEYVAASMRDAGLTVERQVFEARGASVANVIGVSDAAAASSDVLVIGAHYDSVIGTVGANDNASGVAALLELARALRSDAPATPIRFVAFVNEEPPFFLTAAMGSRQYAMRCRARGERVRAMLSLETLGCYSDRPFSQSYPIPLGFFYPRTGNFVAFVGNLRSRALVRRCVRTFRSSVAFPCEGAALPGYLPGIFWSDHWSFWREGYPAAMVTDTALFRYGYYHLKGDTPEKLDYGRLARVVLGLRTVVLELAAARAR